MRSKSLMLTLAIGACTLCGLGNDAQAQGTPSFTKSSLQNANLSLPTSLQFGPDGRLYVGEQTGFIKIFDIERTGTSSYTVIDTEVIGLINTIPNHNDDGTVNPDIDNRMVTGILVTGTPSAPVIYATCSDPRIAVGQDSGLDTNSSMIVRLSWTGTSWEMLELVRGLPRSEENHAANGMAIDEAGGYLYLAQGGNTNMGAPSHNFGQLKEYALAAAILRIDLNAIGDTTYDIPTLDDPSRPNTGPGGSDLNDPFGGNNGANQAMIVAGGPVEVWAPGYRNPFDVVITSQNRIYTIDNGPNRGWGGPPVSCNNDSIESGSESYGDGLHYVADLGDASGKYGGHPCPFRASNANTINGQSPIPPGWGDPRQCDYLIPGVEDGALHVWNSSTNGLTEYTAGNFGGAMQGDLLAASWNTDSIERIQLSADGTSATVTRLFSNVGGQQLDVTTQGPGEAYPGTIWSADLPASTVWVFEPQDLGSCTGVYSTTLDEDGDGYTNADEIDAGSDPCSGADVPADFDDDKISDKNDPDDDNDGVADLVDAFAIDSANGLSTAPRIDYGWAVGQPGTGLLGLGFTGLMSDGSVDYLDRFVPDDMTPGGAAGKFTIDNVSDGDAQGPRNSQDNAFQLGVNVSEATGVWTLRSSVEAPFFNGRVPVGHETMGIFVGTGDQDNYIKLVMGRSGGNNIGARVLSESGGTVVSNTLTPVDFLSAQGVALALRVDPVAGNVQPFISVDGAPEMAVGAPVPLQGALLDAVRTPGVSVACGIISTSRGGSPFAATWDYLRVESAAPSDAAALVVVDDPTTTSIDSSTWNLESFAIMNDSGTGQEITRVIFDLTGTMMMDMVFDPFATAGDTGGRDFTPGPNAGGVGLGSHAFTGERDGGYDVLEINFDDFEPGETFTFAVDCDPTSILGSSSPGPNESGSVSGLELAGAHVTVEFSDGSVFTNDLFRVAGSLDASQTRLDATMLDAPSVDVLGVNEPGTVSGASHTVRVVGDPGQDVRLLVIEGGLFLDGVPGGGHDIDPYEANSALSVQEYNATIGGAGFVDVGVSLAHTGTSGGISHIAAAAVGEGGMTGQVSVASVVERDDSAPGNQSPIAVDDSASVARSMTRSIALLNNDSDPDGSLDPTSVLITHPPVNGSVEVDPVTGVAMYTHDGSPTLSDSFAYTVADDLGANSNEAVVSITVIPGSGDVVLYRVNAGGPLVNADGGAWEKDTNASPSGYVNASESGNQTATTTHGIDIQSPTIPEGTPEAIFQSERWDPSADEEMRWSFPVPAGQEVEVRLYLAETFVNVAGGRIFDVLVEGQVMLEDYDVFAQAGGKWIGVVERMTFTSDGSIDIEFLHEMENPAIKAIEIVDLGGPIITDRFLHRINAGGAPLPAADGSSPGWSEDQAASPAMAFGPANPGTPSPFVNSHQTDTTFGTTVPITLAPGVPSSVPAELFKTERWDQEGGEEMRWSLPVVAGSLVEVRLYIAEIYTGASQPGQRVFDVFVEDELVFPGVDRVAEAGGLFIGTVLTHQLIAPDDMLDLTFGHVTENPAIAGLEIVEINTGVPGAPAAVDDVASVATGGSVVIDVLANDHDSDGSLVPSSVRLTQSPSHGSATVNPATGAITYTHNGDGASADSIAYTVDDNDGNTSNVAGVSITIGIPDNDPPVAVNDSAVFSPGVAVVVNVLANDSDSDGSLDPSSLVIVTPPSQGTASVDTGAGTIIYTGASASSDSLTYMVRDDVGDPSNVATVSLTANPAPVAVDDNASVEAFGEVEIDVLANDTDNGTIDPTSIQIESAPAFGSAEVNGFTGEITYTHDGTTTTSDSFTYSVADTQGGRSAPATVTVSVTPLGSGVLLADGLVLRLESDSGVSAGGGEVSSWADQAGGLLFFPEGAPAYVEDALNGQPALTFDGLDDALRASGPVGSLPLNNADRSVFLIARYRGSGPGGFAYGVQPANCPTDGNRGFEVGVNLNDELSVSGLCPPNWESSGEPGADDTWMCQSVVLSDSLLIHRRDGVVIDTLTHTYATGDGPAVVGRSLEGSSWVDMDLAAVLVYDRALSDAERQAVERYLELKYLNTPPNPADDSVQVEQYGSVEIDVLANDIDPDGVLDPTTVRVVVPASYGDTDVDPVSGVITYSHGGLGDADEFMYTVRDQLGSESAPALVSVSVNQACPADLAAPFGVLDVSDISAFLSLFSAGDPAVDYAEPDGEFTVDDVLSFLIFYTQGCP